MEPQGIAAPYEPVYPLFPNDGAGLIDLPTVKTDRHPIVWRKPTVWDHRRYEAQRQGRRVRYWFRSWWWPARIRRLEAEIRSLRADLDEDWD